MLRQASSTTMMMMARRADGMRRSSRRLLLLPTTTSPSLSGASKTTSLGRSGGGPSRRLLTTWHTTVPLGNSGRRLLRHPSTTTTITSARHLPVGRLWSRQTGTTITTTAQSTTTSSSTAQLPSSFAQVWKHVKERWIEYLSIPCVAAFVGITTNWMGVKMLFYPIDYVGIDWKRWPDTPWGFFGWQGVVPTKTEIMAIRLVNIVTTQLLSLEDAFARLHPATLGDLLIRPIQDSIQEDCGNVWASIMKPILPILMPLIVKRLQKEIDQVLDLDQIVLDAFVRDKIVLVDLFQKVGRVELEFLVNSGFGFGFVLGLGQMLAWARLPMAWTLPAAGALVGYVTNWIAIKLLFEPAEPINIGNLMVIQGLFESRQVEVSDEFGQFMNERVLNSKSLLQDLASGGDQGDFYHFLRRHLPYPIPSHILKAAVAGMAKVADNPHDYPHIHRYVAQQLDIEKTLARQLKTLSPKEFEDLLHPVFQEDEVTLIATGGVLGLIAGGLQTQLGWGGPNAKPFAMATIAFTLLSSFFLYGHQKYEASYDPPLASQERLSLQKRETILRAPLETDPPPAPILETVEKVVGDTVNERLVPTVHAVQQQLPDVPGLIRRATMRDAQVDRSGGDNVDRK